jgi:hypothetical protein
MQGMTLASSSWVGETRQPGVLYEVMDTATGPGAADFLSSVDHITCQDCCNVVRQMLNMAVGAEADR